MYEIGQLLKITVLLNFLIVPYSLESNNSGKNLKLLLLFYTVASVELMKTPCSFRRHFPKFMENKYAVDTRQLLPSITVQRTKKLIRIVLGFWVPICPQLEKGTLFSSKMIPSFHTDLFLQKIRKILKLFCHF